MFLQEIWMNDGKKFDEKVNPDKQFKTFFKSAMKNEIKRGRPYGGIGWIISNEIGKTSCYFESERISYLKFNNIIIIGVYMHFYDGKSDSAINDY